MSRAALAIALLALVGTWGGPAVADGLLTGRDIKQGSVRSGDIRDRTLKGRDVKSNSLTGRVIAGLSGRDLLPDSIDGSDIVEQSLDVRRARAAGHADTAGRAESAARADALAGAGLARVHGALAPGQSATLLELGGLTLRGACSDASVLSLRATTAAGSAKLRSTGARHPGGNQDPTAVFEKDDDFRPGEEFDPLGGASDDFGGQLVYVAPDGGVVTLAFLAEDGLTAPAGSGCLVAGTATHASG